MKKNEILAVLLVTAVTLAIGIIAIKVFLPSMSRSNDLEIVQISKTVPPFFDNIFQPKHLSSSDFIVKDPLTKGRGNTLFPDFKTHGPSDILGFRNDAVPRVVDILSIGDSQTYGTNVPMSFNWPSQLNAIQNTQQTSTLYNTSLGGWGPIQYFYALSKFIYLKPKVAIVAFYTGNDALDAFMLAYGADAWQEFRSDPNLSASDAPEVEFPPKQEHQLTLTFKTGTSITYTPKLRFEVNQEHPAIEAGYQILLSSAEKMADIATTMDTALIFTIIPTKELVYSARIEREMIETNDYYKQLVSIESLRIKELSSKLEKIPGTNYVDLTKGLKEAAMSNLNLYSSTFDGHPSTEGHRVIANEIFKSVQANSDARPQGLLKTKDKKSLVYLQNNQYWNAKPISISEQQLNSISFIDNEELQRLTFMGTINLDIKKEL